MRRVVERCWRKNAGRIVAAVVPGSCARRLRFVVRFSTSSSSSAEIDSVRRMLTTDLTKNEAEYERFRARTMEAEEHLEAGRFAEAIAVYEDVLVRFKPNFYLSELYLGLGCAFVGLGEHAHGVDQFRRALAVDEANVHVHLNMGLALVVLGDKSGALKSFSRGAELAAAGQEDQTLLQFTLYCGQLCEELGDDPAALHWYQRGISVSPDCSQLHYLAGCVHSKRGDTKAALKALREATECSRPWPSAYYKLSKLVTEPLEKRKLFARFVEAQREMAEAGIEPLSVTGSAAALV